MTASHQHRCHLPEGLASHSLQSPRTSTPKRGTDTQPVTETEATTTLAVGPPRPAIKNCPRMGRVPKKPPTNNVDEGSSPENWPVMEGELGLRVPVRGPRSRDEPPQRSGIYGHPKVALAPVLVAPRCRECLCHQQVEALDCQLWEVRLPDNLFEQSGVESSLLCLP